jgi:hypothetical protein
MSCERTHLEERPRDGGQNAEDEDEHRECGDERVHDLPPPFVRVVTFLVWELAVIGAFADAASRNY